ncbi:MAG: phage baseplate assembly protein V [Chloroflexota bacterium]
MEPNGIVIGIVADLEDPEKLGRVKVTFPHLDGEESNWARLATLMAGKNRGSFFRPEVGDEVLVAFLQGNIRYPFIIGSLWNGKDMPPPADGKVKENNWRFIKSRSGHTLKFDDTKDREQVEIKTKSGHCVKLNDTKGEETIEIVDKDAKRKIVIDCAKKKLKIICDEGDVEVKVPNGAFKVDANTIEMKSKTAVKTEAGTSMEFKAKAALKTQAQAIEAQAQASMRLQASATMDIKASGPVTVKGAIINLN